MPENQPPPSSATAGAEVPGIPFYERERNKLKMMLLKKRELERALAATEEKIYTQETEYLHTYEGGNIIVGFENYTKGSSNRRRGEREQRVFSRSSVTFKGDDEDETIATPAAASPAAFAKAEGGASTPASATSGKAGGGGGAGAVGNGNGSTTGKKNKKGGEDSDGEGSGRDPKKARTNFGATTRK